MKKLLETIERHGGNYTAYQDKIRERLNRNRLQFGNRLQLTETKILQKIDALLTDENSFIECEFCQEKISLANLGTVDGSRICDECLDSHYISCTDCGKFVYNDDINVFDDEAHCKTCYFTEKQKAYHEHVIISPLILTLAHDLETMNLKPTYDGLKGFEFKIAGHNYQIERYAGCNFRLGSWSGNNWVDIGNVESDLLRAIDYDLGEGRKNLTNIIGNNGREI